MSPSPAITPPQTVAETTLETALESYDVESSAMEPVLFPPGDLWSNEPEVDSDHHRRQMELLIHSIEYYFRERQDFYVTGNLTIYFSPNQRKPEDFRGSDFFFVAGVEKRDRRSWVVWQEDGKYPNVIIEILSHSTAAVDKGLKKQIYQDIFRTPEYFWFNPYNPEITGFQLMVGHYQPLQPNSDDWLWSQQLGLYLGIHASQLRFFTPEGQLLTIPDEVVEQERQRADQEQQRADQERQRAEKLAMKLHELGIDPSAL